MKKSILLIFGAIRSLLSQTSPRDGRYILLGVLVLYFLIIFLSSFFMEFHLFWNYLGVPVPGIQPPFADLRSLLSAVECYQMGFNVIIDNPCDPRPGVPMTYPRIWFSLLASLGVRQSQTLQLGIGLAILFFGAVILVIKRLNRGEAVLYSVILCSPMVMAGVERGNNDLLIFIILALAIVCRQSKLFLLRFFSYSLIMGTAILKIYPFCGLITILKESKKAKLWLSVLFTGLFLFYLYLISEELMLIAMNVPRATIFSYGYLVVFDQFNTFLSLSGYPDRGMFFVLLPFFVLSSVVTGAFMYSRRASCSTQFFELPAGREFDFFQVGLLIYMVTFILGHNWDYRLIFLIFTIPYLLTIIKSDHQSSSLFTLILLGIVATLWLSRLPWYLNANLDEVVNWILFTLFVYLFFVTLPRGPKHSPRNTAVT
ncbi:hypothetical protein ACFL27_28365 [candidate division CSSED10-310 bacterium]|uniref:Glycosyltransferase RgtA/B/C/D-like domain-containing protein n=1 Tax=candidate division CSSED10-310 bacterium TaxID=2855610 RepID=A0ABV6Z6Y0_UNCC1